MRFHQFVAAITVTSVAMVPSLAAASSSSASASTPQTAKSGQTTPAEGKKAKKICRPALMTGSRLSRSKVCATAEQWRVADEREREAAQDALGDAGKLADGPN